MCGRVERSDSPQQPGCEVKVERNRAIGIAAIVAGAIIVLIATTLAAGGWGGGKMGFIACGCAVGSIVFFAVGGYLLSKTSDQNISDQKHTFKLV